MGAIQAIGKALEDAARSGPPDRPRRPLGDRGVRDGSTTIPGVTFRAIPARFKARAPTPRPMRALRLAGISVAFIGIALLAFALPGLGQLSDIGEAGDAKCLACHRPEGMTYVNIIPEGIEQAPAGGVFNLTVTLQNPWLHHIEGAAVSLNLTGSGFSFIGGEEAFLHAAQGTGTPGQTAVSATFPVRANSTEIHVGLVGDLAQTGVNDWDLVLVSPSGKRFWPVATDNGTMAQSPTQPSTYGSEYVTLRADSITMGGLGEWTAEIYLNKDPAFAPVGQVRIPGEQLADPNNRGFQVFTNVYYNASGVQELFLTGAPRLDQGESYTYTFPLRAPAEHGAAKILVKADLTAIADVPKDHPENHPPDMQDVGRHIVWQPLEFVVGDTLITQSVAVPIVETSSVFGLLRAWAYVLGFVSAMSLVPSIALGGTFGRGSVRWLNKTMGARRRVLWHNSASWILLFASLAHLLFFLIEPAKAWTVGMLWGGLSFAAMIMLAWTGALQRRLVEQWGFGTWRFIHFMLGVSVIAFTLIHMGLDGTDFQFVRDWLS